MITEVMTNLIGNSIRYAKNKVAITASGSRQWVEVCVANDGPIIPQEKLETIFEMFTQLDRAKRTEHYKGTGLGLAVCKAIVEYHHGEIWADSLGNSGVAFHFTLPR